MFQKEQFAKPWQEFARRWEKYYTPPGRPSKQAIEIYRHLSKEAVKGLKRKPRGLVFGATPELRDLLADLKFEVTIIDINLEMILAMSELAKKKNPDEIVVRSNWLSSPLASNYYDVVVGDAALPNIRPQEQTRFLKEIKRVLTPKGYWITKLTVVPNDWQIEDFEVVLDKFAQLPWHKNNPMELFCYLLNNTWSHRFKIAYASKIKDWLDEYKTGPGEYKHSSKKITKYFNNIWGMWKPLNKQWSFRKERDTVKQILPYFKIVKKFVLNDCYYRKVDESYPIWICQVKK